MIDALALRIAWRSFHRHRRRSLITASAIALGLALMLIFVGIADDGHARMAETGIRFGSGHVVVQGRGFQEEQVLDYLVAEPAPIIAAAERQPGVVAVTARVQTSGLITAGNDSAAIVVVGADPHREPLVSSIAGPDKRVAGSYLRPRNELPFVNQPADIYLGARLAETLQVELDDRVVVTVAPRDAERPTSAAFYVRGIFRTGVSDLDGLFAQIPLTEAQAMLDLGESVTQVAVLARRLDDTAAIRAGLERELAEAGVDLAALEILPWQESLKELYEALVLDDYSMYMMMAIIFIIVAIGIFNTVLMSVIERTREFGVMLAIGTSRAQLVRMVLAEALILGIIASAAGLALGLGVHAYLAEVGIDVVALYGADFEFAGVVFDTRIYSHLEPGTVLQWTLVVIGIAVAASIHPALRASRLEPVEAMRHA